MTAAPDTASQPNISGLIQGLIPKLQGAMQQNVASQQKVGQQQVQDLDLARQNTMKDLNDPNQGLEKIPLPPIQEFQDPINAFKGIFPAIALLGAARSRTPAIAAAKAAGAAMEAYHKNDAEQLKLHMENYNKQIETITKNNEIYRDSKKMKQDELTALLSQDSSAGAAHALASGYEGMQQYIDSMASVNEKLANAKYKERLGSSQPTMSDAALELTADQIMAGDSTNAMRGLGRGQQLANNINAIKEKMAEKGATGKQLADADISFAAQKAEQTSAARAIGTKGTVIELSSNLLNNSLPILKDAFAKVDNSKFKDINSFDNYFKDHMNDPDLAALNEAILNTESDLALLIRRGGASTVDAATRAEKIINNAMNSKSFDAVSDQIQRESAAARQAEQTTKAQVLGKKQEPTANSIDTSGIPPVPASLLQKPGLHYSPSRKQYKDDSGTIYDEKGDKVQ